MTRLRASAISSSVSPRNHDITKKEVHIYFVSSCFRGRPNGDNVVERALMTIPYVADRLWTEELIRSVE